MTFLPGLLTIFSLFPLGSIAPANAILVESDGAYERACEEALIPYGLNEVNVQHNHALLRWSYDGLDTTYKVLLRPQGTDEWTQRFYVTGPRLHLQVFCLEPATTYEWVVRPVNDLCCGSSSSIKSFTTLSEPCSVPADLDVCAIGECSAWISWSGSANAHRYKLRYRPLGSDRWATKVVAGSDNRVRLMALLPGTVYEWKIKTLCQSGHVAGTTWSAIRQFQTISSSRNNEIHEGSCPITRPPRVLP